MIARNENYNNLHIGNSADKKVGLLWSFLDLTRV